jgi:hypothetical protein
MWRSGASGLGVPGTGKTWTLSRARRVNAVIAAPPSQQSSAGRVTTCPSAAVMLAGAVELRQDGIDGRAGAVACDDDRDLLC